MDRQIIIERAFIDRLTHSGIYIDSSDISAKIKETYIANCQASRGAGIHSTGKNIQIDTTCITGCYANNCGSTLYAQQNTKMIRSTIYKCAPNGVGADDNIYIENGQINYSELNVSKVHTKGATCCQFKNSKNIFLERINHINCTSEDFDTNSRAKFFESISLEDDAKIKNSIFANSFTYSVVEFVESTGTLTFENCYFSENTIKMFFWNRVGDIPKIIFSQVVITKKNTESISLGTNGLSYLTDGEMPKFFAGYNTAECVGHFGGKLRMGCTHSKIHHGIEGIVFCFPLLSL